MPAGKPVNELTDIEVDRLDAVDSPASRRKWLILKATGEATMDPKVLEQAALALCESLKMDAAEAGLAMSEGSLAALNALAQALGLSDTFSGKPAEQPAAAAEQPKDQSADKAKAADQDKDKDKVKPEDAAAANAAEDKAKAEQPADPVAVLAKSVLDLVARMDKMEARGVTVKSAPPSTQPKGQDPVAKAAPKKMGEGLFANVVFGE